MQASSHRQGYNSLENFRRPVQLGRKTESNSRTLLRGGFDPDSTAILLHDALTDCKPESATRIIAAMETLERGEDLVVETWVDSQAVVAHRKDSFVQLRDCRNVHARRVWLPERDRIHDQVPEQVAELRGIAENLR